jgi:hypothetical protein
MRYRRSLVLLASLIVALFIDLLPKRLHAQSLRGSPAKVNRVYEHANANGLYFYRTSDGIRRAAANGRFVHLRSNRDYEVARGVSHPFALPEAELFVRRLGAQYRAACGERLVVTSAARPRSMRLPNGSPRSVHPTGMAIDLRKPSNPRCLSWLRRTLGSLDQMGVIEATEERRPPHFHVAVYPRPYRQYVQRRGGGALATAATPATTAAQQRYRVRQGDSLWSIARRHETSVDRIKQANRLRSATIRPGQELVIPAR